MSARDLFHHAVKQALCADGWTITDDPLVVQFGGVDLYIDLGAEKLIAAEKEGECIAVEVKSFLGASLVSEFHTALGQFLNYRFALQQKEPHRSLFLAVPIDIYHTFFTLVFTQGIIQQYNIKLLIYYPDRKEVAQWIK
nr:element excision factor XisH family protein [Oscillochloris trichoides]